MEHVSYLSSTTALVNVNKAIAEAYEFLNDQEKKSLKTTAFNKKLNNNREEITENARENLNLLIQILKEQYLDECNEARKENIYQFDTVL